MAANLLQRETSKGWEEVEMGWGEHGGPSKERQVWDAQVQS